MDINNRAQGQQPQRNEALLPRSRFNQQQPQIARAGQQLNNTWGSPPSINLSSLLAIILQLLNALKGCNNKPTPAPAPPPAPTPVPGPIQPVYGVIQPPVPQPVYGVIQPPVDGPKPPVAQPVYGVILPPETGTKPVEPPTVQPVYGAIVPPK